MTGLWSPPARRVGVILVDTGPAPEPLRRCRVRIADEKSDLPIWCPHLEGHAALHGYPNEPGLFWTDDDPRRIEDAKDGLPYRLCEWPCEVCATAPPQRHSRNVPAP